MNRSDFEYDYVEYYVGMAKMVAYWHIKALGFKLVAHCGPETGVYDKLSFYLEKNNIKLVITSAYQNSAYDLLSFVDRHGNGVKRIAIRTANVEATFNDIIEKGGIPIEKPTQLTNNHGTVDYASIKLFDDNEIAFVNYDKYKGVFMPGYESSPQVITADGDSCLEATDHMAHALRENESIFWGDYMNKVFGSKVIQEFKKGEISSGKAGLTLKVLQSEYNKITNVLVEPDNQASKSQVQEYLDESMGTGVQHIAYSTHDIVATVKYLRQNGVEFNAYPDTYYELMEKKVEEAGRNIDVSVLKEYGILCDIEEDSYLLQIFTKPIGDRPTFFYEIVQRVDNYVGFGLGNVSTLFKSVEIEQEKRSR